uniref:sphingosine kinase n=1 Tax=Pundamilia nyererei TaxID=303518 RepID=A0A3B4GQN2_9CICH
MGPSTEAVMSSSLKESRAKNASREDLSPRPVRRPCRIMMLVNPQSGRGQALQLFTGHIQGMLTEASVPYTLVITEHQNHARELVRKADLSQWDALVIMSGDGLLFEVINGLMDREDWQEAIQIPLGILPGGSGNALAASVHHYSQSPPAWNEELLLSCGFMLCKGLVGPLDLVSVHLASKQRLFSFLSLAWGFVADVDIESEKYRHVGAIRFLMGTLVRLASLRVYQGRLAYLPVKEAPKLSKGNSLLPDLEQPVPDTWTVVKEEDFVLVLAIYQSHLAEDLWTVPGAMADDGLIHLFYVTAGISRPALLRLFLAMEKGGHLACGCPHLVYEKVKALRLEPITPQGMITVDGEVVEYGPVQAQIHPGIARLMRG